MPKGASKTQPQKARCGLCGKKSKLIKTECCGNWICDDEHKYVLFSYANSSCDRNHRGIPFVRTTIMRVTKGMGKIAGSAGHH